MMGKIVKSLNSVNSFSKNIIMTGCYISLFLCMVGILLVGYNNFVRQEVELYNVGSTMIYTAGVLFANVTIGGLIIDFFNTMVNNNDD
ncbi:MAG: hypothetical protein IJ217_05175 [Clostridia bacterium]|nr:hypothetical protein [Clostridia bacterium]